MAIYLSTEICKIFNIRYPIFLAGMAGIPNMPSLVAAVSHAGGFGTLGAAYMTPEALREAIREIRELTQAPFGVNLFCAGAPDSFSRVEEVQQELNKMRDELGVPHASNEQVSTLNDIKEQFAILLEERVPVISTTFGLLPEALLRQAKSAGMRIVSMVTTVNEAILAEQAGCDAIVAQGSEAGGHRGTFDVTTHPMGVNIGTMALVPQIVDQVTIPVIAAGGIMDGRGLIAALALGAQGVQLGTRFLTAEESGAHPSFKKALLNSTEENTVITKSFSGRPARGIANHFIRKWEANGVEPLPFPVQNAVTRDIRDAASQQNNPEYMSLWAGQGTRMLTANQKAEDIIMDIMRQAREILR